MTAFKLIILGSNSAFPAFGRFPTAQALQFDHHFFLIDCGEGTQLRLQENQIKKSKIDHIFISHMHGDHIFGLPGLVTSYAQIGRTKPLHIVGPLGIQKLLNTIFLYSGSRINFEINYTELSTPDAQVVYGSSELEVIAFPLRHRIETYGYRFQEKEGPYKINKEILKKYPLTTEQILDAKSGLEVELNNGTILTTEELTLPRAALRSYAYCSDTAYDLNIIPHIKDTTVLYHETTFLKDMEEMAEFSKHSTTVQAAEIAIKANAKRLITGHYSSRYKDLSPLLSEVQTVFPTAELGLEGVIYEIE